MPSMVEAAHAAMQAQRARRLAERLREEVDSVRRLQEQVIPQDLPVPVRTHVGYAWMVLVAVRGRYGSAAAGLEPVCKVL